MMRHIKFYLRLEPIICFMLSFLLSLLFVVIAVVSTLRLSSTNSSTMRQVLISSNYCNNLYQEIESDTKMYTISTGLPMGVLEGVFRFEEVQAEVNSYIETTLRGETYYPDTEKVRKRLEQKIEVYLNEMNIRVDTETYQNIGEYITSVTEEYGRSMEFPLLDNVSRMNKDYWVLYYLIAGVCAVIILLILILRHRGKLWYHPFLFNLYTSSFAATMMLAVIPAILLSKSLYSRLQISPSSLYYLATDYIKVNLQTLLRFSALFLMVSLVLLLIDRISRLKLMKYVNCLIRDNKLMIKKKY